MRAEKDIAVYTYLAEPTSEGRKRMLSSVLPLVSAMERERHDAAVDTLNRFVKSGPLIVSSNVRKEKQPAKRKKPPIPTKR